MQRRSFLKAASAMLPAASLKSFALEQVSPQAAPSSREIHVVGSGQDRFGESHSLGFSSILFKVPSRETNGGLFVIEHENLIKGAPRSTFTFIRTSGFMSWKAKYCSRSAASASCFVAENPFWARA
jgi:hypothetical protein